MIILDTDHLTVLKYARDGRFMKLAERMADSVDQDFATTAITLEEQLVSARRTAFYSFEQRSRSSFLRSAMVQRCWGWEGSHVLGSSDSGGVPSGS